MKSKIIQTAAMIILLISSQNVKAADFFTDGFESGDKTHTENGANWYDTYGDVSISSTEKYSGTHSMRFRYGSGVAHVQQGFDLGAQKDDVYIRYYVKFPSNYIHGSASPSNNKLIRLWSDASDYSTDMGKMGMSFYRSGNYSYAFPEAKAIYSGGWKLSCNSGTGIEGIDSLPGMGQWHLTADDLGKWLAFEFHFKRDDGSGNGALEFWVDGVKQFGSTTLAYGGAPCQDPYFKTGYLFGWANAAFAATTDIYVDDVVFSDKYIGPVSDNSLPPAPTVPLAPSNFRIASSN